MRLKRGFVAWPHFLCQALTFFQVWALLVPTHFRLNSNPEVWLRILLKPAELTTVWCHPLKFNAAAEQIMCFHWCVLCFRGRQGGGGGEDGGRGGLRVPPVWGCPGRHINCRARYNSDTLITPGYLHKLSYMFLDTLNIWRSWLTVLYLICIITQRTRGHGVTLVKKQCRLDIRQISFSQRIVNEWNRLSADCVSASSVNIFKNKSDIHLRAGYT